MKIMGCRIRQRIKIGLGRKAQIGFNEIMAVAWLLFITGVALSVYFIVHTTLGGSLDTSDVEGNSIADNILFSGAISYYDEDIDRIYPEVIDSSKFNEGSLDNSLNYKNKFEKGERNDQARFQERIASRRTRSQ